MATKKRAAKKTAAKRTNTRKPTTTRAHHCAKGHPLVDDERCRRAVNTGEVCK